jgi:glycosyltransferase involved in cell wall biosynthesis
VSGVPLVSVCVPNYNYGRFLRQCIESVRTQTLSNWELLICDDHSTDDTYEIVSRYVLDDKRITFIRNQTRLGMCGNLKRVSDLGRGKYLKILCADDWLVPHCLETMVSLMDANPHTVLATSAEFETDEAGHPRGPAFLMGAPVSVIPGHKMIDRMARGLGFGGNSSFLIRSEAYRAVGGYNSQLRYLPDYELAARLCRYGDYLHTDEPLFYGRQHSASSSSMNPAKLLDVIDFFDISDNFFRPRPFGGREWRRYQRLSGLLTARAILNAITSRLRGNSDFARRLLSLTLAKGNLVAGSVYFPIYAISRLVVRVTAYAGGNLCHLKQYS